MKHICVISSVHVNPSQDFNEWAEYRFNQVKHNYKSKISYTKLDPTPNEDTNVMKCQIKYMSEKGQENR